jgi:hypothetical protein
MMRHNKLTNGISLLVLMIFVLGCSMLPAEEAPLLPALELESRSIPPAWMVVNAHRLDFERPPNSTPFGFGQAIALGDGVAAVGAPARMGPGLDDSGRVYIFRRGPAGWVAEAELTASDKDDGFQYTQQFGSALALQDGYLYVGAPAADDPQVGDNTGAVYIFEDTPGGWVEIGRLTSPEPFSNAQFGTLLALQGRHLAVVEGQFYEGNRLWLFQGQGADWQLTTSIDAPELPDSRGGIIDVDLYGDTLAVAMAYFAGEGPFTEPQGWVELHGFDGARWHQIAQLPSQGDDGGEPALFFQSITLDGRDGVASRLAVGSSMSRTSGFMSGAVYLYAREGEAWRSETVLAAAGRERLRQFVGWLWGGGFARRHAAGRRAGHQRRFILDGVAYLYQHVDGYWYTQLRLTHAEDGGFGDFFGASAAIYGDTLLIAAPSEYGQTAFVFEIGVR